MSDQECTPDCIARRPLGSESHISTCPNFMDDLTAGVSFLPRREEGQQLVVRPGDERPVVVPDEVVSEAERDYRAYIAFRNGTTWEDIAHAEQYPSAEAAAASVKRYLNDGRAIIQDLTRKEIVADHVSRLMWARSRLVRGVEDGKPQAVMAFLAVEDRWVKAFGLDQPDAEDQGVQTVVVPSEEYLEMLRRAAETPPQADAG